MGVLIMTLEKNKRVIWETSHSYARDFFDLTAYLARLHHIEEDVFYKTPSDEYWIDPDLFCELVEKLFAGWPALLFFGWAQEAVPLYESIKQQKFIWYWKDSRMPHIGFETYGPDYNGPKIVPVADKPTQ